MMNQIPKKLDTKQNKSPEWFVHRISRTIDFWEDIMIGILNYLLPTKSNNKQETRYQTVWPVIKVSTKLIKVTDTHTNNKFCKKENLG